jgi:hypothetical protein
MKTHLLIILSLIGLFVKVYSQDSTKTQITFLTKDNQPVPLYQEIYVGDFEGQGYDTDGITYQHGIITRKEFLLNAPSSGYFEKDKQIVLVATDDKYYKMKFTVDTKIINQKWLLAPAGKDYYKGQGLIGGGFLGIILSSMIYGVIGSVHHIQMDKYKMDMDQYNFAKGFPMTQNTTPPHKPKSLTSWYILPTLTMNFSIISLVRGRIINSKNRPSVVRIQ